MIIDYFRPKTISETLDLQVAHPNCRFIGGGTSLLSMEDEYYAIDLQYLGLNLINKENSILSLGATATLEKILGYFVDVIDIVQALRIEGSKNQRNRATLGGLLMSGDGRSPFLTCLASMKCKVFLMPQDDPIEINQFFVKRVNFRKLITKIEIDLPETIFFESIARSPIDKPIVCCAVSTYKDGPRLSIGGYGSNPILVQEIQKLNLDEKQLISTFSLIDDQWASASFRATLIKTLSQRLLNNKR